MDSVNEYSKGMCDKNREDLPHWEEVEKAAAERTPGLAAPSPIFLIG